MTGYSHDDKVPYHALRNAKELSATCVHCGFTHDLVSNVTRKGFKAKTPNEGDITLCVSCGEWNAFGPNLVLRRPTDNEFVDIARDPGCMRLRWAWVQSSIQRGDLPTSKGAPSNDEAKSGTEGERK